jgi:hypothetical protein
MLTTLATLKTRLEIDQFDLSHDAILTSALTAISSRFDKETNRTLARTVNFTQEFDAADTQICLQCYPFESLTRFELKTTEAEGWIEQPNTDFLIRRACILSLPLPFSYQPSTLNYQLPQCRATYTGGYVLPGATVGPGQTPLPSDLEQAAVEQVACWFQHRDKLGIDTTWPHAGTYEKLAQLDLLLNVQTVLRRYQRFTI